MGKEVVEAELYKPRFFVRKRIFNKETQTWNYEYEPNGHYWIKRKAGNWDTSSDICSNDLAML